jgi:hypothetical protein
VVVSVIPGGHPEPCATVAFPAFPKTAGAPLTVSFAITLTTVVATPAIAEPLSGLATNVGGIRTMTVSGGVSQLIGLAASQSW